jgi:hypothetical protein
MHTDIHDPNGIRTHDSSVAAIEDSSCLIPRGTVIGIHLLLYSLINLLIHLSIYFLFSLLLRNFHYIMHANLGSYQTQI